MEQMLEDSIDYINLIKSKSSELKNLIILGSRWNGKSYKNILAELELPYRILNLCGGDLGFSSALTFDFEIYSAAQERWLEAVLFLHLIVFRQNGLKSDIEIVKEKSFSSL